MMTKIEPKNSFYLNVKESLLLKIESGEYRVGEKIPSTSELCKEYGVSSTTVRRAIVEMTQEGVLRGVGNKGVYVSSFQPRSGRNGKIIGVILPCNALDTLPGKMLEGIKDILELFGYKVLLATSGTDDAREAELIDEMMADGISGIIVIPCGKRSNRFVQDAWKRCCACGCVLVYLDFRPAGMDDVACVSTNNQECAYELTKKLTGMGHRKIAFLSMENVPTITQRFEGYAQALSEAGIALDMNLVGEAHPHLFRIDSGRIRTEELLRSGIDPTAIIAATDEIGVGVYSACQRLGMVPGRHIAVASVDRTGINSHLHPAITAVEVPLLQMGRTAASIILRKLSGMGYDGPNDVILNSTIFEGESCCLAEDCLVNREHLHQKV